VDKAVDCMDWEEISTIRLGELSEHRIPLFSEVLTVIEQANKHILGDNNINDNHNYSNKMIKLLIDMDELAPAEPALQVCKDCRISNDLIAWCGFLPAMHRIRSLDPIAEIFMPWNDERAPTAQDIESLKPQVLNSDFRMITTEKIHAMHKLGCRVSVWTVDEERDMRDLIRRGVDSITSNFVPLLQEVLLDILQKGTRN
jgi:hypothetical protein